MSTYVFPFPSGSWERTDQGVDFGGAGNIQAVGAGQIVYVGTGAGSTGWPGLGTYILEKLTHPYQGHQYVYYAEDINPSVRQGQSVNVGSLIGKATGGSTGVELGFGSSTPNVSYARSTTGYTEGQATTAGSLFRNFLQSLAAGKNVAATPAPAHSTSKSTTSASGGGTVANPPSTVQPITQSQAQPTAAQSGSAQNAANQAANQQTASQIAQLASQQQQQAGQSAGSHNVWNDLVFAFVGTGVLAVVAQMNERLGRVLLAIMIGFLFVWFLAHSQVLAGIINRVVPQTNPATQSSNAAVNAPAGGAAANAAAGGFAQGTIGSASSFF
jgi:hypothetical protein